MDTYSTQPRPERARIKIEAIAESYGLPPFPDRRPALWPDVAPDSPAALLWPGIDPESRMIRRLDAPQGAIPYSEEEEGALKLWVESAWVSDDDSAPLAVVALGRGAGLDEPVLRHIKGHHVYRWGDFLAVHDPATRHHPVAVGFSWAPIVEELAAEAGPEGFLVCPSRTDRTSPSFIPDIVAAAGEGPEGTPALDCERLQATWIVHHLRCGTDAVVLLRCAGFSSFSSLDPFLDYVEWRGDEDAFYAMGGD